ncbi:MAG: AIPR family protein [Alphaproteobacteria bacterium]
MVNTLDWSILDGRLVLEAKELGLTQAKDALPAFLIHQLLDLTIEEAGDCRTDQSGDRGIDAFFLDERDSQCVLHLFNCKYVRVPERSIRNFPGNEIDKVSSFVEDLLGKNTQALQASCHPELFSKVQYLWKHFARPDFRIHIYFCSNQREFAVAEERRCREKFRKYSFISFHEYPLARIVDELVRKSERTVSGNLQIFGEQSFARIDGAFRGLVGTSTATQLVRLVSREGELGQINLDAFNDNIRVFLGITNAVNRSIYATALESSNDFWYLNNGVTIVCERFQYNPGLASPIVHLRNFQIVNGGQTSNALYEAWKRDPGKMDKVYLLVRIYEAEDPEIKLKIAAATNTQTPIKGRDLRSNEPIQKRLEEGLRSMGLYYERKKGQYSKEPADKRIDALRAAQTYIAYFVGEPEKAKTQSDRVFGEWYEKIFNSLMTPERIYTSTVLGKILEEKKSETKRSLRGRSSDTPHEDEFIVEGLFHVLFVAGLICRRDGVSLDDFARAQEKLEEAISRTREIANKYRSQSFYRFFRSIRAKEILRAEILGNDQQDLFDDFATRL